MHNYVHFQTDTFEKGKSPFNTHHYCTSVWIALPLNMMK